MWTWTTTAVSENVHIIEVSAENLRRDGNTFELLVQSDQHFDNVDKCDRTMMKRHLEQAREKNAPVIGLGDLFCAMQGRHDKRKSAGANPFPDREDYFDAIVEECVDFHRPYADLLTVYGRGNHETSVVKNANTDLLARWAYRLGKETDAPGPSIGGYGGWIFLRFKEANTTWKQTVKIKYYHGSGGGGPVTKGVIGTNRRAVYLPDADVILTGHIHNEWNLTLARERITNAGRIYLDEALHVQCPTYKEEYGSGDKGWHILRGAPPKPVGGTWLSFRVQSNYRDGGNGSYKFVPNVVRAR